MEPKLELPIAGVESSRRFPSPVKTPHPENNTVHAEYYRPEARPVPRRDRARHHRRQPDAVAAHRDHLAQQRRRRPVRADGVLRPAPAAGQRAAADVARTSRRRRRRCTQTVLDLRRASAWLESRPEVDPKQLGIIGTSLGSFVAALTGEMEPRLGRVVRAARRRRLRRRLRRPPAGAALRAAAGDARRQPRTSSKRLIAPIDPITCAANLKERRAADHRRPSRDEIVPPAWRGRCGRRRASRRSSGTTARTTARRCI